MAAFPAFATAGRPGGLMIRSKVVVIAALAFGAGLACAELMSSMPAQNQGGGTLTEWKRVDLGSWCEGKEAVISIEQIAPQHQGRHSHPAYSFAWMIEGSQTRFDP